LIRDISQSDQGTVSEASFMPTVPEPGQVASISELLARYGVDASQRDRVAKAISASSLKYNVDPKLVASVIIVESGANPFAVSDSNAVGIMQIHVPTWGLLAEKQGINLFKIEDNADLGVQILSGYIKSYGEWGGVATISVRRTSRGPSGRQQNTCKRSRRSMASDNPNIQSPLKRHCTRS